MRHGMKNRQQQQGMSILGILAILVMVGFFVMCAIRMGPVYFEYLSVKDIVSRTSVEAAQEDMSPAEIRRRLATIFNTNQIYALKAKQVEIYRKKGKTYIDASYEVRQPVLWRIDSVLVFNDLQFEVGNPDPLLTPAPTKDE